MCLTFQVFPRFCVKFSHLSVEKILNILTGPLYSVYKKMFANQRWVEVSDDVIGLKFSSGRGSKFQELHSHTLTSAQTPYTALDK